MKSFRIGTRWVGCDKPAFIVAEVGINHSGSYRVAKEYVEAVADTGADAIKFQVFTRESRPKLTGYQLTYSQYVEIKRFANKLGLIWFATPFDVSSVNMLQEIGVPCYKIAHGDAKNLGLLFTVAETKKPILVSIYGELYPVNYFNKFYPSTLVKYLHCVGKYPTPWNSTNLLQTRAGRDGYSSHTTGIEDCVAARVLGAYIIEKHIKLDGTKPIDNAVSIVPSRFKEMVQMIRNVEKGL